MNVATKSKYINESREKYFFHKISILYIFALYMLPPYFGVRVPGFDLTAVRITIIFLFVFIVADNERINDLRRCIRSVKISPLIGLYTFILVYTMVLRVDITAFLNPFIEFVELYLLIYVITDNVGVNKVIKMIIAFLYVLIFLGIVEYVIGKTPFLIFSTISRPTLYSGAFVRSGYYRIMSNCVHSLGYGLLLMTAIPFAGIDVDKNEYNVFKRPLLIVGIAVNVFLTGSRSSLGVMLAEFFLMFILSDRKYLKYNIVIIIIGIVIFSITLLLIQPTTMGQYIMLQITSLIDSLFDTTLSEKYGADIVNLHRSSSYRDLLWKIFELEWLNPLVGLGKRRGFSCLIDGIAIQSIDNFYVIQYIQYAYPGFITYLVIMAYMLIQMIRDAYKTKLVAIRMILIGVSGYYIHLIIADSLSTLKYLYVLFAIYFCCTQKAEKQENKSIYIGKKESIYVR